MKSVIFYLPLLKAFQGNHCSKLFTHNVETPVLKLWGEWNHPIIGIIACKFIGTQI